MAVLEDHASEPVISTTRRKLPMSDLRFDHIKVPLRCMVVELELWMIISLFFVIVSKSPAFGRSVVIVRSSGCSLLNKVDFFDGLSWSEVDYENKAALWT